MCRVEGAMFCLLLLGTVAAWALPPDVRQRAQSLSADALAQLQSRQQALDAMTPGQHQAFVQRILAWDALPAAVRRERREHWQAWQALPLDEQQRVRAAAIAFAALPAGQQQALHLQFTQLDGSTRRGWLLGPALGADYVALQPLLAQVPIGQRESLLQVLRTMAPAQRRDLAVLAQRTPPQQRAQLRRDLLSTSDANRSAWLRMRMDQ